MKKSVYVIKSAGLSALNLGIGIAMPLLLTGAEAFRGDKEKLRRMCISVNNLSARHRLQYKSPRKALLLLPHCMQNKNCSYGIAENIENCHRCGGCKIGEAADSALKFGVKAVVAKGGTAARNIVKELRPDFIIAVACERELVSGIRDVGRIPVMGVINRRPDGYCTNTTVDMFELCKVMKEFQEPGRKEPALPLAH